MPDNNHDSEQSISEIVADAVNKAREAATGRKQSGSAFSALEDKNLGVLPSIMRAIKNTADYRQELKTANWKDINEPMKCVAAIHERLMCGVPIDPIIDRIIAESAGVASARLELVIRGLTHTVFNTNQAMVRKNHWWNGKGKSNSQPAESGSLMD